ncbi:GntR family transcriptional regulator [Komagataeibacter rhaeticus]|nr:GntR family transcriptional regulator [Komagataeibacter rhaeticus]
MAPHLPAGDTPAAERLADALAGDILGARLNAGDRLPAHRDLAWRLGIGIGSVTRAYGMLERRGLVRSVRGRGTFVASHPGGNGCVIDLSANMPPPCSVTARWHARFRGWPARWTRRCSTSIPVAGHIEHRRIMSHWLAELGVDIAPDGLLLASGAQQALGVALAASRQVARTVLTEDLTYPGMLSLLRQAGLPRRGWQWMHVACCPRRLNTHCAATATGSACCMSRPPCTTPPPPPWTLPAGRTWCACAARMMP